MSLVLANRFTQIEQIAVFVYKIPTDYPESDGTFEWESTTIVVVEAHTKDDVGVGYTYASSAAAVVIEEILAPFMKGKDVMDIPALWREMQHVLRNVGTQGIGAAAISAVDSALWDLKARMLDLPLVTLLGQARESVPVYGSGGFTSYTLEKLEEQLSGWVRNGIKSVKIKIGRSPEEDSARLNLARRCIGPDTELFVDANGAFTRKQALTMAQMLSYFDVHWFEEPVSSDDLCGLNFLREKVSSTIEIAAGEYGYHPFYFRRMLEAGAVDVLQADATRCLGITGFLTVGALSETFNVPLSSHTAPSLHLHPCCALRQIRHMEYFYDHLRIEGLIFDGAPVPLEGRLYPDLSSAGMGLKLNKQKAAQFQVEIKAGTPKEDEENA